MRQLTGELSKLRKGVELPFAPIHDDYRLDNAIELSDGSWVTLDLDFVRVRERLYDIAGALSLMRDLPGMATNLNPGAQSGEWLEPRRLLDAYERTAPEPLTPDEHRWLPGALALVPLHWAATAGLVGDGIREAESAMTAAEAWWSRRAELQARCRGAWPGRWRPMPPPPGSAFDGSSKSSTSKPTRSMTGASASRSKPYARAGFSIRIFRASGSGTPIHPSVPCTVSF